MSVIFIGAFLAVPSLAEAQDTIDAQSVERVVAQNGAAPLFPREIVIALTQGETLALPEFDGPCNIENLTGRRFNPTTEVTEACRWQGEFFWEEVDDGGF